jgi:hypothetical protein
MKSEARRVISRADDFGASDGANHAILEAVRAGFIRNVGLMAPGPALEEGVEALLNLPDSQRPCLGLHATINSEWETYRWGPLLPRLQAEELIRSDNSFHPHPKITVQTAAPETILNEVCAQLQHLRSLGVDVHYLDTHMNFDWIPGVREGLDSLSREEGLVRQDRNRFPILHACLQSNPPPDPEQILGELQSRSIEHAVWVFHPNARDSISEGFFLVGEEPSDRVARCRDREFRILTDPQWTRTFLDSPQLRLSTYLDAEGSINSG